jgi:hypothetical protein
MNDILYPLGYKLRQSMEASLNDIDKSKIDMEYLQDRIDSLGSIIYYLMNNDYEEDEI